MLSGSVPLKVETTKIEWFYPDLKPWVNYVPIKSDYSDLLEVIEWLKANDAKARDIVENAVLFARYHFQPT
jgi:protein glucosyltransferase